MQDVENDRYTDAAACEATHQGGGHAIWFLLGFFWTTAASIHHGPEKSPTYATRLRTNKIAIKNCWSKENHNASANDARSKFSL